MDQPEVAAGEASGRAASPSVCNSEDCACAVEDLVTAISSYLSSEAFDGQLDLLMRSEYLYFKLEVARLRCVDRAAQSSQP